MFLGSGSSKSLPILLNMAVKGLILLEIVAGVICWGVIWTIVLFGALGEITLRA